LGLILSVMGWIEAMKIILPCWVILEKWGISVFNLPSF
jgi:hypothetical protein